MQTNQTNKLIKKNFFFLNIMNKNKTKEVVFDDRLSIEYLNNIMIHKQFIRLHVPILSIIYVFESTHFLMYKNNAQFNTTMLKMLYYYAGFNKNIKQNHLNYNWNFFHSLRINNVLSFSKPKKQIFMVFFKKNLYLCSQAVWWG